MATLENIKEGDRVVYGTWDYRLNQERKLGIHTVTKVTRKRFATDRHPGLHSKDSGKEYNAAQYMYHRIATAKECVLWDAEQSAKREQDERAKVEQEAVCQKGVELYELFPANLRAYLEMENDAWNVTLRGLTEEEVRQLAIKLNMETDHE